MALKYREDKDLAVLALASHDDLQRLARILTHDVSDSKERRTQELLSDLAYKAAVDASDLRPAWMSIAAELQAFGGDSIANAMRAMIKDHTGVLYREIVTDICGHLKLNIKATATSGMTDLENQFLIELLRGHKNKFSAEDLKRAVEAMAQGVGLEKSLDKDFVFDEWISRISTDSRSSYLAALVAPAIASAAIPFLARLSLPAVVSLVAPRVGGAFVPGLQAAAVVSTVTLITSPAIRVTLPAVLEVIRIRRSVLLSPVCGGKAV